MIQNCRGGSTHGVTQLSQAKRKQAQDKERNKKVAGLHKKVDLAKNVRGAERVGQAISWGMGRCGDSRISFGCGNSDVVKGRVTWQLFPAWRYVEFG
jgi:hypothetical protein